MTKRRRGSQLRQDILRYLLKRERSSDSSIPGLDEIASALGVSREDVNDQLDILESQGAIRSNRTFKDAAPILTGAGKAILEEMEEDSETFSSEEITEVKRENSPQVEEEFQWDAFICHASEDKDTFVRRLANELINRGIRIWYDEFTLRIGDSLRRSIDKGLAKSRYGIVVLSHAFFAKEWPQKELDGLVVRERNGQQVILPVWLDVSHEDVAGYSLPLADRVAAKASDGFDKVVAQLLSILGPNSLKQGDMGKPDRERETGAVDNTMQELKASEVGFEKIRLDWQTTLQEHGNLLWEDPRWLKAEPETYPVHPDNKDSLWAILAALRRGESVEVLHRKTSISIEVLQQLHNRIDMEKSLLSEPLTPELLLKAKNMGFSFGEIGILADRLPQRIRELCREWNLPIDSYLQPDVANLSFLSKSNAR